MINQCKTMGDIPFTFEEFSIPDGRNFLQTEPGEWVLLPGYKRDLPRMYNMELREDDVWLLGLMKSGTTWASEMIWTVCHNADTSKAKETPHFDRWNWPDFLSCGRFEDPKFTENKTGIPRDYYGDTVKNKSRRFIRTHLPLSLLNPELLDKCKVIYVLREPRDCVVSMTKMVEGSPRDVPDFASLAGGICGGIMPFGPWLQHIKLAWNQRNHPNMLFIEYEDMKKNLKSVMKKVAKFLAVSLTDEQYDKLEEHLSVKSMKANKSINMEEFKDFGIVGKKQEFIRKGEVGGWKSYFTPELEEMWVDWLDAHLGDTPELRKKFA